ncbi:MAG: AbrB/MazE/SpoVT family DNA-binding domain-containing protein [Candidatus Baldrarchaeia archaeon]
MSLTVRVGKKYAIYLPKAIVEKLGIKEGDVLVFNVRGDKLIVRPVKKFLKARKAWSSVSFEEIESVGEEISAKILE